MSANGYEAERWADEVAEKALDDLEGLDLLGDPEFLDWALEVAYEERDRRDEALMYAELAHGLG